MNKRDKVNIFKAGVVAYSVSSFIAYLKHGGIQFINQSGAYVLKVHKTLGIIDVFRLHGKLSDLHVFGDDWIFFVVGIFSGVAAAGVMLGIQKYKSWVENDPIEKTEKGFKVKTGKESKNNETFGNNARIKVKRKTNGPVIRDFEIKL